MRCITSPELCQFPPFLDNHYSISSSGCSSARREKFLKEMEVAVPWQKLEELIEPHAPSETTSELGGRPAYPVSVMLRVYFCQSWYQLSDEAAEDSLNDSESISTRRFCLGTGSIDAIPDERSIRRFRHLLEEHKLSSLL
jgi:hypothetical protein